MANPYPLQAGDRAPNYSGTDNSRAADRRPDSTASPTGEWDANAAPSFHEAEAPVFKSGVHPRLMQPPYEAIFQEGDTSGEGTVVHEVDILKYGDAYDPTAPMRVRMADNWHLDSDGDGHLN